MWCREIRWNWEHARLYRWLVLVGSFAVRLVILDSGRIHKMLTLNDRLRRELPLQDMDVRGREADSHLYSTARMTQVWHRTLNERDTQDGAS